MGMPAEVPNSIRLRPFRADDATAMEAVFGDPDVMRFSDFGARSRGFVEEWIDQRIAQDRQAADAQVWAVVETATGKVAGYAGFSHAPERCGEGEAELGFRLASPFWGFGYATLAATMAMERIAVLPRFERAIAIVDPDNAAALRVVEKLGMRFEREVMFEGYDHADLLYALDLKGLLEGTRKR